MIDQDSVGMATEHKAILASIITLLQQLPGQHQSISLGPMAPDAVAALRELGATVTSTYYASRGPARPGYVIVSARLVVADVEVRAMYDRPARAGEEAQAEAARRDVAEHVFSPWCATLSATPDEADHAPPAKPARETLRTLTLAEVPPGALTTTTEATS